MDILDLLCGENELYERTLAPVQQKYRLTHTELSILLFLANNPGYDTANDLVRRRHMAKSHVSASVRTLEEKNLLRKEHRNGNNRTLHLVLSPDAQPIIEDGRRQQRRFHELLTCGLTDTELRQFESTLSKIQENITIALRKE